MASCLPSKRMSSSQRLSFTLQQELGATLVSTVLPGPVTMPQSGLLLCGEVNLGLQHSLPLLPQKSWPRLLGRAVGITPLRALGETEAETRLQGSHPLSSPKAGPGFSILSLHRCDIIRSFNSFYSQKGRECVRCGFLVCTLIRTGRGSKVIC